MEHAKLTFGQFTNKEFIVIQLRTHGIKAAEIARRMGVPPSSVRQLLKGVYRKTGFNDVALLTRWAIENALDEPLGPEKPEERPVPGKPVPRKNEPIRLGRIRRARRIM